MIGETAAAMEGKLGRCGGGKWHVYLSRNPWTLCLASVWLLVIINYNLWNGTSIRFGQLGMRSLSLTYSPPRWEIRDIE